MIIYCDNHLLIADKPPNLLTQSEEDIEGLTDWAKNWIKKEFAKAGNVFLHPVHRLDRAAMGLVLFARTSKALARLNSAMRARTIIKKYVAIIEGTPAKKEGILEHILLHDAHRARLVKESDIGAKKAELHYRVLATKAGKTLVEIELYTGRYHQIRAQFSLIGHPVWGDKKYASVMPYPQEGIALCHQSLAFEHPVQQKKMTFFSKQKLMDW